MATKIARLYNRYRMSQKQKAWWTNTLSSLILVQDYPAMAAIRKEPSAIPISRSVKLLAAISLGGRRFALAMRSLKP